MQRSPTKPTRRTVLTAIAAGALGSTGTVTATEHDEQDEQEDLRERARARVAEANRRIPSVSTSNGISILMDCDSIRVVGDDRDVLNLMMSGLWCENGLPGTATGGITDPDFPIHLSQEDARQRIGMPSGEGLVMDVWVHDEQYTELVRAAIPDRCREGVIDC